MPNVQPITGNVHEISPLHMVPSALEQMEQITSFVRGFCPPESNVHLTFDGRCAVHIDVRSVEEVIAVEAAIQKFAGGMFGNMHRTTVPGRAFLRRVSATIN